MVFLYPSFLWFLALLIVPIIIHLFYFKKYKKVYFSNNRFLQEIKEQSSVKKTLKNLLTLIARLLAIAAIICAFAQPFISENKQFNAGSNAISIYIDNSFSMAAERNGESLLQLAKKKANEIVEAFGESDEVQILTADFEGQSQKFNPLESGKDLIDVVQEGPNSRTISSVLARQTRAFYKSSLEQHYRFVLSDFQEHIVDDVQADTTAKTYFIPLDVPEIANIAIDTVYVESGVVLFNQANVLKAKVTNYGNKASESIRMILDFNGQQNPVFTFSLEANQSRIIEVPITPSQAGWQKGILKINDAPIKFDDQYYFSFYLKEAVEVLSIQDGVSSSYLKAVFNAIEFFNFSEFNTNNIQYQLFKNKDLIILNDLVSISSGLRNELAQYLDGGGNVIVFPNKNANKESYNAFFKRLRSNELQRWKTVPQSVSDINIKEFVFQDVYTSIKKNMKLPNTKGHFEMSDFQNKGRIPVLSYRNGDSYLSKYIVGKGSFFICAAPLNKDGNDLVLNAEVFVPMLYKMALSKPVSNQFANIIGKSSIISTDLDGQIEASKLRVGTENGFIPGIYKRKSGVDIDVQDQIKLAGFYELFYEDQVQQVLAFNYAKEESKRSFVQPGVLSERYANVGEVVQNGRELDFSTWLSNKEQGRHLWRYFIIAALLFLLFEQVIIRFFK